MINDSSMYREVLLVWGKLFVVPLQQTVGPALIPEWSKVLSLTIRRHPTLPGFESRQGQVRNMSATRVSRWFLQGTPASFTTYKLASLA